MLRLLWRSFFIDRFGRICEVDRYFLSARCLTNGEVDSMYAAELLVDFKWESGIGFAVMRKNLVIYN